MDAFALVPTYVAVKHSAMTKDVPFVPGAWQDWAGRLLVGTEGIGWAPSLGIGVLLGSVLVTCVVLTIRDRRTITWVGLLVLVALSLRWHVTSIVWHGFDSPDGNFFREAFVLVAMQVILLWQLLPALTARGWKRSGVTALIVAIGYAAVVAVTRGSHVVTARTALVSLVLAAVAVVLITALARGRRIGVVAVAALVVLVAGEVVVNHVAIIHRRETRFAGQMVNLDGLSAKADVVARVRAAGAGGARVGVTTRTTTNDPMLFGGASGTSYTTMMPKTLSDLLVNAGMTAGAGGRRLTGSSNLLEDTAFGVSQRVTWRAGRTFTVQHPGVTLARWVPSALVHTPTATAGDPLALYSALLQLPRRQPDLQHGSGALFPTARFSVGCPVGSGLLVVNATTSRVTAKVAGQATQSSADPWTGHLLVLTLSPTARAEVDVTRPTAGTAMPAMTCTTTRPAQLGQPAPIQHDATGFTVQVPAARSHDTLLLATAATDEWSCQQSGSTSRISTGSFHRLLTVAPGGAGVLTCRFTPRAFPSGVLVSLVALLAWLATLAIAWRRSSARPRWRRPRAGTLLRS
ncbi:YfhO family protein [Nostocoides sp. HKS02]|uniref:YfhO family protein n=1 Tax=Nostocoides sp. HKS02 TaxID=1813880 RepID=UPI0012B4FCE5|nr:YfhO family protein [Tetrasphaera sp. HKS02]QGN56998.1 YfhO family protein [Tetrasphaera sp. HKS02]